MKTKITLILIFISLKSLSQDINSISDKLKGGISINYGYGSYSVKDEYISGEKYSGSIPYFSLDWTRKHNKYAYRLEIEYRNSDKIKNYNVRSNITQFSLNQGFIYPLKKIKLFNKDLNLWFGPNTELFFFNNDQNIAVDGFDYTQSFAALFSAGIYLTGIYQLSARLQAESVLSTSCLSLGFRMVDDEEDNQSPVKLLTLLSGSNSYFDLGIRYNLFNKLSIWLGYKFELSRINKWTPMISASDNALISLTYAL